jgi:hypothetical protein
VPPEQVELRAQARSARQIILTGDKPPKLDMIVDEAALRRVFSSPEVMARQLRSLAAAAELPNVRLWVVPFERGRKGRALFALLSDELPQEQRCRLPGRHGSSTYLELPEKIDYFRRHAAELAKVALDPPNRSSSISQEGTNDGAGVRHR